MKKVEKIFPIVVGVLSLISSYNHTSEPYHLSNIVSIIGLLGASFYFLKFKFSYTLISIWIYSQFIVIPNYIDLTQVFNFNLGFFFELKNGTETGLYLNIVPFIYVAYNKLINVSKLIGNKVEMYGYRNAEKWGFKFPIKGEIIERFQLNDEKGWLLTKLDNDLIFKGKSVRYVLLKPKNRSNYKVDSIKELSFMRVVIDEIEPKSISDIKANHPFLDWVLVRVVD